jgi:hypothetical protein
MAREIFESEYLPTAKRSRNSVKFKKGVYTPLFFFLFDNPKITLHTSLSICRTGKRNRCSFKLMIERGSSSLSLFPVIEKQPGFEMVAVC